MDPVVVVGGGIGGLAAAADLARLGQHVLLLERAATPGGKLRQLDGVDAGPTVFTMRWVFEQLFADAGEQLDSALTLHRADVLARHAWPDGSRLDLYADVGRSADAVGALAGPAERRGFLQFCQAAQRAYTTLEGPFIRAARPTPVSLARDVSRLSDLLAIKPFQTLWQALGTHFRDGRLRQLFGRYATYCGSSPFRAPATLMLVAHVEQEGVWLLEGGMVRLADALADLARRHGATVRTGAAVAEIVTDRSGVTGVLLADGERVAASAVVVNADVAALAAGLLGGAVRDAGRPMPFAERSLSAVTWTGRAPTSGFALSRHNVFFSSDYAAEFDALAVGRLPDEPTTYVCAQDRDGVVAAAGEERLLVLVNAPAKGAELGQTEMDGCAERTWALLRRAGLDLPAPEAMTRTGPAEFDRLFPGTGGALYGAAVHGAMATFRRPGCRTRIPGLYLAGGSTHPGAGVPMAALSGRLAASALMADRASTRSSRRAATPGGMSMR